MEMAHLNQNHQGERLHASRPNFHLIRACVHARVFFTCRSVRKQAKARSLEKLYSRCTSEVTWTPFTLSNSRHSTYLHFSDNGAVAPVSAPSTRGGK